MKISNKDIAKAALSEINAGKASSDVAKRVAAYLVNERRSKDADSVVRQIERLLGQDGQVELNITTARGISEELLTSIKNVFAEGAKKVIINEKQDPSVLGGVLVESGEQRLDLTVRRQIQRLKGVRV